MVPGCGKIMYVNVEITRDKIKIVEVKWPNNKITEKSREWLRSELIAK